MNKVLHSFLFCDVAKNDSICPGMTPNLSEDDVINEYMARFVKGLKSAADNNDEMQGIIQKLADFVLPGQETAILRIQKYVTSRALVSKNKSEKSSLLKTFTPGQLENMIKNIDKGIVKLLFIENTGVYSLFLGNGEKQMQKVKSFRFLMLKPR